MHGRSQVKHPDLFAGRRGAGFSKGIKWGGGAALAAGLLLGLGLGLSACKQGENERCQLDEDCGPGLYCELTGSMRSMGGYCKSTTSTVTIDMTVIDMTTTDQ